jgi:amino acid adenylation domain-containing protein/non-ribosomal peptide synthase protein (TIGR01720 family)
VLEAYGHQDLPFEKLVEELQPERDLSHDPLFQVMFTFQTAPVGNLHLSGLKVEGFDNGKAKAATFDLSITLKETLEGLNGGLEFKTDLFSSETIQKLAAHYRTILENVSSNSDLYLESIEFLSESELHQLLVEWVPAPAEVPDRQSLLELFSIQAAEIPDAIALIFNDQTISYRDLDLRSNQLGRYLYRRGIKPESIVGLCFDKSLEMMICLLAVWKAGAAFVPLDPQSPAQRNFHMLQDAQVNVVLTRVDLTNELPRHSVEIICLDQDWDAISGESSEGFEVEIHPANLAYIIFTSGSTGLPKAVQISHHNLLTAVAGWNAIYNLAGRHNCYLQMASFSFDVFIYDLIFSLCFGGRLVFCPTELLLSPEDLYILMQQQQVNSANFVPVVVRELMNYIEALKQNLNFMRLITLGGEISHMHDLERLHNLCGPSTIISNGYGVTECSIDNTYFYDSQQSAFLSHQSVIGRPFSGNSLYVLDRTLQPVPIGVHGELHIGGNILSRGYRNHPDLTAAAFLPNPFSVRPGERLYRTGDLVRWQPDGNLEYLGRIDQQIKLRGFRIELGEIETALRKHPGIRDVALLVPEAENGHSAIVAYVVPDASQAVSSSDLREYARQMLPMYMVPAYFIFLDELPVTISGKLDRKALSIPEIEPERHSYESPRTSTETILCSVWTKVLKIETIGINENFFELGGDSILAIQIVSRARQAGLKIKAKDIFSHQTIAELATVAIHATASIDTEEMFVSGLVPLTPIQHSFLDVELPDPHYFNQSILLRPQKAIDTTLLRTAIYRLLAQHDALRMRFERLPGGWQQMNAKEEDNQVYEYIDLSGLSSEWYADAIEKHATRLQQSLNLSHGPIMRAAHFRLGEMDERLLLIIHHLSVDGVSWRILLEDLETIYAQLENGQPVQLPPKATSFKKWAEGLVQYAQSPEVAREAVYWLAENRLHVHPLPRDYRDGVNAAASRKVVFANLDVEETRALLRESPRKYNVHINAVLLAALVESCERWTGLRSLLVDLEGHGREDIIAGIDISRTVGWFTTIYPVLLFCGSSTQIERRVQTINDQLKSVPQKGIGYGLLKYLSADKTALSRLQELPGAEIIFNYLGQLDKSFDNNSLFAAASESTGRGQSSQGACSHVLEINASVREERFCIFCSYSENIHKSTTIQCLIDNTLDRLRLIIGHCQAATTEHNDKYMKISTRGVTDDELHDLLKQVDRHRER